MTKLSQRARVGQETAPPRRQQAAVQITENDLRQRLAANLNRLRRAAGLTQAALAQMAGMSVSHVKAIEAGDVNATLDTIIKVANGVDATPIELLAPLKTPR